MFSVRVSPSEFDKLVEDAVGKIRPYFRDRLDNLAIVVEQEGPNPGLLGLYQGRPLPDRSVFDAFQMPDRITIFQRPHEHLARDRAHLAKLVEDTVWHEVAHYFGMDEAQVRRAERRRGVR